MVAIDIPFTDEFLFVLSPLDDTACRDYEWHMDEMIRYVNQTLSQRDDLQDLIGSNPIEVMYTNHANHAAFMLSMFRLHSAHNLVQTIIWVYRTYTRQGFSLHYFTAMLPIWQMAVARYLDERNAVLVNAVYQCIIDHHQTFVALSNFIEAPSPMENHMHCQFQQFLAALLKPDLGDAIKVAGEYIHELKHIPEYWEHVIQPAMYEIGRLWAEGKITVGQEHLATSITQRVISVHYPMILSVPRDKGTIVVTVSPGEMHEIGPRMLADILEMNGWDVHYTGINTPMDSLIKLLHQLEARFLCISTTLLANLPFVADLITQVKTQPFVHPLYIIVGGQAYEHVRDAWEKVGADSLAFSASELLYYLEVYHEQAYLPAGSQAPKMAGEMAHGDMEEDYLLQELPLPTHISPGLQELIDMSLEYGKNVFFHHTRSLIALLHTNGDIVEGNENLKHLCERWSAAANVHELLVASSRAHMQRMIHMALERDVPIKATLHFGRNEVDWPASYECCVIPVPDQRVIFYATLSPPLDERAALEYLHITNELASTTRELQKTRHQLMAKQQALEEAFARIERFAYIDELTQLLNRRSILARLAEEIERSMRYETDLSIFILDVDDFKQVNDTYGHQAGDRILQLIAQKEADALRRSDLLGRYGGEEFLAILPGVDIQGAFHVANRLRKQVGAAMLSVNAHLAIQRTVSIGVAQFVPQQDTMESLLAHADSSLYRAKQSGRNQVCIWEENDISPHQTQVPAGE